MNLVTVKPQENLKQIVKEFWYTNIQMSNGQYETYQIIGDGTTGIIFQHFNGRSAVLNAEDSPLPISFAYGQNTQPCKNKIVANSFVFGINFQPTAFRTLFNIDTSEITNAVLDAEHLFSRQFNDQILNTTHPQKIIHLFEEKLSKILYGQKQNFIIDKCTQLIMHNVTDIEPKMLSSSFHLSTRQIQRKFKEYTGVCLQTYIRIAKFQRAVHLLRNKQYQKLSDIGYGLNYADQSHFNREFKLFSGYTPKAFIETITTSQPFIKNNSLFESLRIIRKCA